MTRDFNTDFSKEKYFIEESSRFNGLGDFFIYSKQRNLLHSLILH